MDDLSAIRHTMDTYGFAVDSLHWELFDDIFAPDVVAIYGDLGTWTDLDSLKQAFAQIHAPFENTRHAMANMACEIEGDVAHCVTYGHWLLVIGGKSMQAYGWYEDELVRGGRGWLIRKRKVHVNHVEGDPALIPQGPDGKPAVMARMPDLAGKMELFAVRDRRLA